MDSVIYALVLSPALTELLPESEYKATPANEGFAGSILFAARFYFCEFRAEEFFKSHV